MLTSSVTNLFWYFLFRYIHCRPGGVVVTQSPSKQNAWVQITLDASRPVTKLWFGTASAGDTHSLACRTNPPTASLVPRHRVAWGYWKGDKHLRPSQLVEETCPCISGNNKSFCTASLPKLEFYNLIKHDFEPESYLRMIKVPDFRKSLTRFRISCHNLERGRYETPLVPREERWCTYCFFSKGLKPIEDESHALIDCLLYSSVREKFNFHPLNVIDLAGLLSNKNLDPTKFTLTQQSIQFSLWTNNTYYKIKAQISTQILYWQVHNVIGPQNKLMNHDWFI